MWYGLRAYGCVMTWRCLQDEERVSKLELELELQEKITEAALKLAKDPTVAKSVRKKRKQSYHKSSQKVVIIAQISMIESMENWAVECIVCACVRPRCWYKISKHLFGYFDIVSWGFVNIHRTQEIMES